MAETVEILRMAYGKGGVAKLASGKTCFVFGGVPGETVDVEITEEKDRYCEARIVSRKVAATPDADWFDLPYELQLSQKRAIVQDALQRQAGLDIEVDETIASPSQLKYRNKVEFLDEAPRLGNQDCFKNIKGALKFATHGEDVGIFRIGVRYSERTESSEVALWTTAGWFPRHEVAKVLQDAINPTSIVRIISEPGKERKVKQLEVLAGEGFWREELSGFKYQVQAPSFFQVNTPQAETLQQQVLSRLCDETYLHLANGSRNLRPCENFASSVRASVAAPMRSQSPRTHSRSIANMSYRIADLYCGCGTFTLPLAAARFDVTGVELAGTSTKDLAMNLKKNNLQAEVVCDDVARVVRDLQFDACVVDPPKSGLDKRVVQALIDARDCKKIVYVSCDPMTLARDLRRLCENGYSVKSVTPVDLFPQTHHMETVVLLTR